MFADFIALTHFIFILFVVFGGLLTIKFKWIIYFHIPAVVWGAVIEFTHGVCSLTIWENQLRHSNDAKYETGFVEHYIIPLIYPDQLNADIQFILGVGVILINLLIYSWVFKLRRRQ